MTLHATPLVLALGALFFASASHADDLQILGLSETVQFEELGTNLPAKLDTGAVTSSMHAENIQTFERGDRKWVRFELPVGGEVKRMELPLAGVSHIKRRAADIPEGDDDLYTQRPLVKMTLCMGNEEREVEVNLTDRSDFSFPVLIGSNTLRLFNAAVDPARGNSLGEPSCS